MSDAAAKAVSLPPTSSPSQTTISDGHTNKEIANQLGIRRDSVEEYLNALFAKLGASNRTEAVAIALRKHLLKIWAGC